MLRAAWGSTQGLRCKHLEHPTGDTLGRESDFSIGQVST